MVERELEVIETDPQYQHALDLIESVQRPILEQLSVSVKAMLTNFLPAIKDVRFEIRNRHRALRQSTVMIVDDGTPTSLKYKGDGVKSLAALALMRHASERESTSQNIIIAVEEPESHLHPEAMHGLRKVLDDLSTNTQIVITTHCPVFVERHRVGSNILVYKRKARPAKTLEEIRRILGVRAADNLKSADLVLVVEGEEDRIVMRSLLAHHSSEIKHALVSGAIAIDSLGGGANLSYKLGELRNAVCKFHCFLDNDKCGRSAVEKAQEQGLLDDAEYSLATCQGKVDSEIEDLFDVELYADAVKQKYNVSLLDPTFKGKEKWSERMAASFKHQGKMWNDKIEMQVKHLIADEVDSRPDMALNQHHRGPFDALVRMLLERIGMPCDVSTEAIVTNSDTPHKDDVPVDAESLSIAQELIP
jgi:putative ATP-dependent endonuclease of OLD family